jgi:hypothetical protein
MEATLVSLGDACDSRAAHHARHVTRQAGCVAVRLRNLFYSVRGEATPTHPYDTLCAKPQHVKPSPHKNLYFVCQYKSID